MSGLLTFPPRQSIEIKWIKRLLEYHCQLSHATPQVHAPTHELHDAVTSNNSKSQLEDLGCMRMSTYIYIYIYIHRFMLENSYGKLHWYCRTEFALRMISNPSSLFSLGDDGIICVVNASW
jgi:hypothetical protein